MTVDYGKCFIMWTLIKVLLTPNGKLFLVYEQVFF